MDINIGINAENREALSQMLNALLADEMLLYIKTKNFHWNVTGLHFSEYHEFFDEQAEAILKITDEVAERVRALDFHSAGSMQAYLDLSRLKENTLRGMVALDMIIELLQDHEAVIRAYREAVAVSSEKYGDEGTADLLTGIMEEHEKMAWMLRSYTKQ